MRNFIFTIITLCWVITLGVYLQTEVLKKEDPNILSLKNTKKKTLYAKKLRYRLEKENKIIGYTQTDYIPYPDGTYTIRNKMESDFLPLVPPMFRLLLATKNMAGKFKMQSIWQIDKNGKVNQFSIQFSLPGSPLEIKAVGKRFQDKFQMDLFAAGNKLQTTTLDASDLVPGDNPFSIVPKMEEGKSWNYINPMSGVKYKVKVIKKTTYKFKNKMREAYLLEAKIEKSLNPPLKSLIDSEGNVFWAELNGMTMIREEIK